MQFWSGSEDTSTWHPKRRHTILGRWHQIKQELWAEHLELCEASQQQAQDDEVPF